jgi:hypothetical protein
LSLNQIKKASDLFGDMMSGELIAQALQAVQAGF